MFRRLSLSIRRDNRINLRNGYYLVTLAVAVIYFLLIRFLIPQDASAKPDVFIFDNTPDARFSSQALETQVDQVVLVESEAGLESGMHANTNSVGLVLEPGETLPQVTLVFQAYHNPQVRSLLSAAVEAELRELYGVPYPDPAVVDVVSLREGQAAPSTSFKDLWVPILLFSDAAMIGLILIAALMFMEKEEGTLKAYLVTPGRVWEYLLSKALTLGWLAVLFTLILTPLTLGLRPNYLSLLPVMFAGAVFTALLGAWVAIYFDNLSQFLFPGVGLMVLISIPSVALFVPGFSPWWLKWIPTYPLVFGLREAVFPTGSPGIVLNALLVTLLLSAVVLFFASRAFVRQMVHR